MPSVVPSLCLALLLAVGGMAADGIQGSFTGDWGGASGAGGSFKLSVARENGKPKCTVSFNYAGEDVKTNVTLCKTDGSKIEAQYDFDLSGNRLQSTIHGERKGSGLEGNYETTALGDGSPVDRGDWKASPAP
jgi:hypothetical protein